MASDKELVENLNCSGEQRGKGGKVERERGSISYSIGQGPARMFEDRVDSKVQEMSLRAGSRKTSLQSW